MRVTFITSINVPCSEHHRFPLCKTSARFRFYLVGFSLHFGSGSVISANRSSPSHDCDLLWIRASTFDPVSVQSVLQRKSSSSPPVEAELPIPFSLRPVTAPREEKIIMPRRPTRHGPRFAFSSFGRSVARVASVKRPPKTDKNDISEPQGNEANKNSMKKKNVRHESSSEEEDEGIVQADFAFFDPKADDFHGLKMLLQNFLDVKQWDLSGFVDLILGQPTVGTVIKIEDDEGDTPFSVVTALNLGRYKNHKCIIEMKELLLKRCPKDVTQNLRMLLDEHPDNVGFLVSQHVANLPPQLLPPLYDGLFDEVSWAIEDEPTEELRKSFCFKTYLISTKFYKHKHANQCRGTSKGSLDDPIIYIKPEDEIFYELSSWSFNFTLHTEQPVAQELKNYSLTGLLMAVEADKIPVFRRKLHALINE